MSINQSKPDVAESYYDSDDADRFYSTIWGGEDIHVGIYGTPGEAIAEASRRTVERIADYIPDTDDRLKVLDLGAGYGGAARWLAKERGAEVVCVNISETQNILNRRKNEDAGLSSRIDVRHGSFDDVPTEDGLFHVVWSQDSFLHGSDRARIFHEAARTMKPGGRMIFTDIMQTPDAPADKLRPIYDRIHLSSLGSIAYYDEVAQAAGLKVGPREEMAEQLPTHYARVREDLIARRDHLKGEVSEAYIDGMIDGLKAWVDGGLAGWLTWGILSYDKPK